MADLLDKLKEAYKTSIEMMELKHGKLSDFKIWYDEHNEEITKEYNNYIDSLWNEDLTEGTYYVVVDTYTPKPTMN